MTTTCPLCGSADPATTGNAEGLPDIDAPLHCSHPWHDEHREPSADFERWFAEGTIHGWISPPFCAQHDRGPGTASERTAAEEGYDPCMISVRVWPLA